MTTFQEARAFLAEAPHRLRRGGQGISAGRIRCRSTGRWTGSTRSWRAIPTARIAPALWIVDAGSNRETKLSFEALSRRSNQVANFLRAQGLKRGDHLLLLLGNVVPLWETMLAAIKLGVVVIPATTLLTPDELRDRLDRGRAKVVVATQDQVAKFASLGGDDLVAYRGRRVVEPRGLAGVRTGRGVSGDVHAGWADQRRRSDAAVFHLGHHGKTKTGAAQPAQLSGRRPVDDVLARAAARRRASEHFLAGLGQARLELFLRAVECRRDRVRGQPAALRRQGTARDHRPLRRHHAVRAADGVAAVHPGEACDLQG